MIQEIHIERKILVTENKYWNKMSVKMKEITRISLTK